MYTEVIKYLHKINKTEHVLKKRIALKVCGCVPLICYSFISCSLLKKAVVFLFYFVKCINCAQGSLLEWCETTVSAM